MSILGLTALASSLFADSLPIAQEQVEAKRSAKVTWTNPSKGEFRLQFDDPAWSAGVRIMPPGDAAHWDLSSGKALAMDIENLSEDKQMRLTLHLNSGDKEAGNQVEINSGIALNPGERRTVRILIPHEEIYWTPEGVPGPKTIDSSAVNWFELQMQWPFERKEAGLVDCLISNVRLVGEPDRSYTVSEERFLPFIDVYGQYKHQDWAEKIHTDRDLVEAHQKEMREVKASKRPASWNQYGGWAEGPQLEATGAFRVEKYEGKWYLVDPSGNLFFSNGLDVLRAHTDATPVKNHQSWFSFDVDGKQDLPFTHWNLQKKYQRDDYEAEFFTTLVKRLEHWGINTIGNWGHSDLMSLGDVPYTAELIDHDDSLPQIPGKALKFYDVFDPEYVRAMETLLVDAAERDPLIRKSLQDPMCIGYFIDNELNFGNRNRQIFTDQVLKSPARQAAKLELVKDLKVQYVTVEKLNDAWSTEYSNWNDLLERTDVPESKGYRKDSQVFFVKAVDQYFRLSRAAIKAVAPHRLYLGCRFIGTDAVRRDLYEAAQKYCDVLSVNIYSHTPANMWQQDFPDIPVMIGEFHFGVHDRGMFSPGLAPVGLTQQERAFAYARFMQGALGNPYIVGAHWFQFRDQPLTGRWDGEGYAIGFVDVADTPYEELTETAREIGENMYEYRARGELLNPMK
ncbi:MAG TPA: beta-agarase [Opitutae bacterium]|nr:beta-agarase [Opitutae bacterium]